MLNTQEIRRMSLLGFSYQTIKGLCDEVDRLQEAERRMRRLVVALLTSSRGGEAMLSDDIFEDGVDYEIRYRNSGGGCWTFFVESEKGVENLTGEEK